MLRRNLDRFILAGILRPASGAFFVAFAALTLEQSTRLTNVIVEEGGQLSPVGRMLVSILPEYCAQALQLSFFFGVLLGFRSMARDHSLVAFQTSGQPFSRLVKPVIISAALAGLLFIAIAGILQPRGEYLFARTGYLLSQGAFGAPIRQGIWLQIDAQTGILAQRIDGRTRALRGVFVEQRRPDGVTIATSAISGRLSRPRDGGEVRLALKNGRQIAIAANGEPIGKLEFESLDLGLDGPKFAAFRSRGYRAKEAGLMMLVSQSFSKSPAVDAEPRLKFRLRFAAILANGFSFLPFALIAAALGARSKTRERDYSLAIGAVFYVAFVQAVGAAEKSDLSPLATIAPAVLGLMLAAFMLVRSAGNPLQNSFRRKTPTVRGRSGVSWTWKGALNGLPKENVFPRSFMTFSASTPSMMPRRET